MNSGLLYHPKWLTAFFFFSVANEQISMAIRHLGNTHHVREMGIKRVEEAEGKLWGRGTAQICN